MVKTLNIDSERLDEAIEKSGLRTGFIVEKLGITPQAFHQKRKGKIAFRQSEVYVLCDLLHLDENMRSLIFFP